MAQVVGYTARLRIKLCQKHSFEVLHANVCGSVSICALAIVKHHVPADYSRAPCTVSLYTYPRRTKVNIPWFFKSFYNQRNENLSDIIARSYTYNPFCCTVAFPKAQDIIKYINLFWSHALSIRHFRFPQYMPCHSTTG